MANNSGWAIIFLSIILIVVIIAFTVQIIEMQKAMTSLKANIYRLELSVDNTMRTAVPLIRELKVFKEELIQHPALVPYFKE